MRINNNLMAMNSQRNLGINQGEQGSVMEKLSSGLRVNRAGDDAAGLAISEKMRNQIKGLNQASRNSEDGISLIQTAEGSLAETHDMLKRMREMTIQSMNDTYTDEDRQKLDLELQQLITEIDELAVKTEFNEQKLLTGDPTGKGLRSVATYRSSLAAYQGSYYAYMGKHNSVLKSAYSVEAGTKMNEIKQSIIDLDEKIAALEIQAAGALPPESQVVLSSVATLKTSMAGLEAAKANIEASAADYKTMAHSCLKQAVSIEANAVTSMAKVVQAVMNEAVGPNEFTFQVGANNGQTIDIGIKAMDATSLGLLATKIDDTYSAGIALTSIDAAIEIVSRQRAELGAIQNRLEHTVKNIDNTAENLQSAESQIRDADMAAEMVALTRVNILSQASQSMLVQANQAPQQVLQLLQ